MYGYVLPLYLIAAELQPLPDIRFTVCVLAGVKSFANAIIAIEYVFFITYSFPDNDIAQNNTCVHQNL